jgi:hypothetical protein
LCGLIVVAFLLLLIKIKTMKKFLTLKLFFALCILSIKSFSQGSRVRKTDFGGSVRLGSFSFTINMKGYIGGGAQHESEYSGIDSELIRLY